MQKKYFLLFFLSLLFTGCSFEVKNNVRLLFTGTVTDPMGNAITNAQVFSEGIDNRDSEILGNGNTNLSGEFRIISLQSTQNNLYINQAENSLYPYYDEDSSSPSEVPTSIFTSVVYVNVPGSMDLGTIKLQRKATFAIEINKTTSSNDTLYWQLSYTHDKCIFMYNNGYVWEDESSCYENFSDTSIKIQTLEDPDFENTFETIIGGTAKFTYHINHEPEETMLWNIDETQEAYVFEY